MKLGRVNAVLVKKVAQPGFHLPGGRIGTGGAQVGIGNAQVRPMIEARGRQRGVFELADKRDLSTFYR